MYSYQDVAKSTKSSDSWIGTFFINPLSYPIVYFLANQTSIRPELVNLSSLFIGTIAAYFYFRGSTHDLLIATFFFIFSYVLDSVDGKLARLKNQVTTFGATLEAFRDKIVHLSCFFGLIIGQFRITEDNRIIALASVYLILLILNSVISFYLLKKNHVSAPNALASIRALGSLTPIKLGHRKLYPSPSITEVLFLLFLGTLFFEILTALLLAIFTQIYIIWFIKTNE